MANYYGSSKTNYFRVTDEEKYQNLFEGLVGEDVEDLTKVVNGETYHCFGGYDSIDYLNEETDEYNFGLFLKELQTILPDNEVFVYMESGHEKLRYVSGYAVVVTNKEIRDMSLSSYATEQAKEMIGPNACINLECPKEQEKEEEEEIEI